MPDGGVLLALPTQSVAIRLALGALTAFVLVRALLRADLRVTRVRVAAALIPIGVLVTVAMLSLGDPRLPTLMVAAGDLPGQVVLGIEGDYAYLAPMALPALLALWAVISFGRIAFRLTRVMTAARRARATAASSRLPAHIRAHVARLSTRLVIPAPAAAMVDCAGGAAAIGIWRPVLLLDRGFVASLDHQELEGVIAHELSHIARRDNLLALLFGLGRDLTFFIPGGNWALRHLLVERELAADQAAVATTTRPGALASGLIKVLESATQQAACAPLLPQGTLGTRIAMLCDDRPAPSRVRSATETASVITAFVALVALSTLVPRAVAGSDPEAGLGVYLSNPPAEETVTSYPDRAWDPAVEARALATYHTSVVRQPAPVQVDPEAPDDLSNEVTAGMLRACAAGVMCATSNHVSSTLQLRPEPVLVQRDLNVRWHARPVAVTGDVVRLYYLSSLR